MSLASEFAPVHDGQVRLAILQLLATQCDGQANDAVLYEALNAADLICSREQVRAHIFWMAGQNLVASFDARMKSGLVLATLTEKGGDVAAGRSVIAGVQRPSPRG